MPARKAAVALRAGGRLRDDVLEQLLDVGAGLRVGLAEVPLRRVGGEDVPLCAEPELNGSGVITWTPGLIRSFQPLIFFGLPWRTRRRRPCSATMPPRRTARSSSR